MNSFEIGYEIALAIAGGAVALGVLLKHAADWLKARHKRKSRYDLKQSYKVDRAVHYLIEELMSRTGAVRVHVYRFHNGADFFDGSSIKRMSCSYEVTQPGVSREVTTFQQLPLSLFADWQAILLKATPHIYPVAELENGHCKSQLDDLGVKSLCVMPLYRDRLIIGAVTLHYPVEGCNGDQETCKWACDNCDDGFTFCSVVKHTAALIEIELAKDR